MHSQQQKLDGLIKEAREVEEDNLSDGASRQTGGDEHALDSFLQTYSLSTGAFSGNRSNPHLPNPVVIPQRRPGNKYRGFVEAYAPALEQFGIQQEEFLSFIRATNKAVQASKWLLAIQVAAAGTSFIPNPIAMGTSAAVQIVAFAIAKAQTRWKTNSLLDRVNEEYFGPRGLYCLLMAYKPIAFGEKAQFDVAEAIPTDQSVHPTSMSTKEQPLPTRAKKNLRNPVAGTTEGEESLPSNIAPLIHPNSSNAKLESGESAKERNGLNRLANYFDDRASARYAKESKGDILSQPSPPTFKNRYLDPNHPATNGGLLGLISGGLLTPSVEKMNQRMEMSLQTQNQAMLEQQSATMESLHQQLKMMKLSPEQEQAYMKQCTDAFELQEQQMSQQAQMMKNGTGPVRKIWNVSYLMIVEMPSGEEIATARRNLEASSGKKSGSEVAMSTVEI